MKALILKELKSFFSSLMGYLVIGFFLVITALFLFVFDSEYNLLTAGFNDLSSYFNLAPKVLILLIPALTMKSISEEKRTGTFELLATQPITYTTIVWSKFCAALITVCIALLPTLIYIFILNSHSLSNQLMDFGSTLGSFLGLFLLASVYCALGILASSLSKNQIVCFLLGVVLCLFFFFGFEEIAKITETSIISKIGIINHFKSISRGVIDSRDIIYFISVMIFVNYSSVILLKKQATS